MKTKVISLVCAATLIFGMSACHDPEELSPTHHDENLLSLTATFYNDSRVENSFAAEIDHVAGIINVVFPYTYPAFSDSHLETSDLTHVRINCNLTQGSIVEPPLVWLDLSKEHQITVTGLDGSKKQYTITSEIRKSSECIITDFTLPDAEVSGAINQQAGTIALITADDLGEQNADVIMSHGATISPDPRVVKINFDQEVKFTVTAQNGVDKKEYTVIKTAPSLLPAGGNFDRAEMRWVKKLSDLGFSVGSSNINCASGFAVVKNTLILNNTGNATAICVNAKTGEQEGTIDLSSIGNSAAGYLNNYRMTSDNNGNIVISNFSKDNNGLFTIWVKKGLDGAINEYLSYKPGVNVGDQVSVVGSLDGDAIITASVNGSAIDFFRWVVKGGQLQNVTPEKIHITGYEGTCWGNADVAYIDPSNPTSDYICGAYAKFVGIETTSRGAAYVNGTTNTVTSHSSKVISSNWIINAVDIADFNKAKIAVFNSVNTFTWGSDDNIYIYDLSTGDLSTSPVDFGASGLEFIGKYGARACGNLGLGRNANDVKLSVSSNGVYLYIYFEFANGFVGCYQVDCMLDM